MVFLDRMERRFGWLAFPGLLRYYALFQVLVFGLQIFRPGVGELLEFDRSKILAGEVWRVVTFLFASTGFGGAGILAVVFLLFMVLIASMMSDALEGAWGVFRTSIFHYVGVLGLIAANFLYENTVEGSGFFLYQSAFFAFATLFPRMEFRLFFVLPVQVRFIAIFLAIVMLLPVLRAPVMLPFFLLSFASYFIFAGIPALRGRAKMVEAGKRMKNFKAATAKGEEAFHQCAVCDRTEISNPELEFRIGIDGKEYCDEHLPQ